MKEWALSEHSGGKATPVHMKIMTPSSAIKLNIIYYFATIAVTEYQLAVFHIVSQFYRAEIQAHNIGEMGFF